jgi:hypothetical protein
MLPGHVIATWPGTSVEHNFAAGESVQDVVNDLAVFQVFLPVREHTLKNLFTLGFGHGLPQLSPAATHLHVL